MSAKPTNPPAPPVWRRRLVLGVMLSLFALLGARVVHLQVVQHPHLQQQGDARYLRELVVPPARGRILDRNGQVLTMSTPVDSLWAESAVFCAAQPQWKPMLGLIKTTAAQLRARCERRKSADFMYIERRLPPMLAQRVLQLAIPGVEIQREYKRYYPGGPAGAHLVGFTDVDDAGQEGLERAYQAQLSGAPGRFLALKDRVGNYVESVESIQPVRHGSDLVISIDQRVQSLATDYLERAVRAHRAAGGSVVVLAVPSGEIIGMVNSPQFNPNDRSTLRDGRFRNRSVTDVIEPGSTVKPFTIAMALERGALQADSIIDTAPGSYRVGAHTIHDVHDYGAIPVSEVIVRSSNIGAAKIALALPYDDLFDTFARLGFGRRAGNLPGETEGSLPRRGRPVEHATLSYGYGLAVTPLQLARAYTALATDGELLPVTLTRHAPGYRAAGARVFSAATARAMRPMLERAASPEGTARKARIPRYRIGGKTGTTHKLIDGAYQDRRYVSAFAGLAPLSAPKFVVVVVVDDPRGLLYYGGDVAAPVFAALTEDLMRLYNIKPDRLAPNDARNDATAAKLSNDSRNADTDTTAAATAITTAARSAEGA
ncbi:MAG: peptidoglycan D,D-transpeptidase FtsI family protein [bacterium]